MDYITKVKTTHESEGPRRFIVNLMALEGGKPMVRSCEIKSQYFRNRTSFSQRTAIDDIFVEHMAKAIKDCLGKFSEKTEIVSLPSFFMEIPGLVLASARLMSSEGPDGMVNYILLFKFVMGGVNRAFRPEIGFDEFVEDQNAHLAASVLADISLPLLNFCAAAEMGVMDDENGMAQFVERLKERSVEIKFQIELVKRFVESAGRAQSAAKTKPIDTFEHITRPRVQQVH